MIFRRSARTLVHLTLAMAAAALHGQAVVSSFTDIGTLGGDVSYAYGINDSGEVVGKSPTGEVFPDDPFLYADGNLTDLNDNTPGLNIMETATAINNAGQVVTDIHIVEAYTTDVSYLTPGNFGHPGINLGTLGGPSTVGLAVNSFGEVAGYSLTDDGATHAFLHSGGSADYEDYGNMTDLGTLGGSNSYAYGINDSAEVVGAAEIGGGFVYVHAFLYTNGTMTDLGTLGGDESQANGINNSGQITGWAEIPGDLYTHAFLDENGTMTDLGTLGGLDSQANGINAAGEVVGNSTYDFTTSEHAFFYDDGTMYDLNTLAAAYLSNGSTPGFISLNSATAINDLGQIIGQGTYRDASGDDYDQAFLLTVEVPEPAAGAVILGAGALLYGVVRRRIKNTLTTAKMECGGSV